ncbi:MAG: endonuclease MutS2, partial [Myxococcales bacterium]|nr:endonuclease MutS2 [Myxococcales bacterium]
MGFSVETKTLLRLEWHELVEQLRSSARTPLARDRLTDLHAPFAASRGEMLRLQVMTRQADGLLEAGRDLPVGDLSPLDEIFGRVGRGGSVTPRELREVASACGALSDARGLLDASAEVAPDLAEAGTAIVSLAFLAEEIHSSIGPDGVILDSASDALARARSETQRLAGEGKRRMEGALRDESLRASLADSFYTVRNDRFVLPVRADARGSVPGIVHDASASGATIFVEPSDFVELNNRHKRAELEALREERRIVAALSAEVARAVPELRAGLEALAELDLIFARAKLSRQLGGVPPEIGDEGVIEIRALRHPLLGAHAVPNDFSLGGPYRVLVISGPNAGGKTVAMKAAALAALCVRAGLYVAGDAGARVDVFDEVLADIGDEQDIRENLSTFSAHMANLAAIVRDAGPRSLVVLDEIGVGTDPSEGAAIAQATLEALAERGARVVTTTHYNLLKELAEVDERFENAAVSFDPETLRPTYELRMGIAGTSSALSVAERMGMP